MWAEPILARVAQVFSKHRLEAILIGNAAAALQGAPVTTVDLDFLIRPTRANKQKLKAISTDLEAVLLRPYYPVSSLVRLMRDADTLQLDFMTEIHGMKSFEGLRSRALAVDVGGGYKLLVAALEDIIKSKRAAARLKDKAVLHALEKTLAETANPKAAARGPQKRK